MSVDKKSKEYKAHRRAYFWLGSMIIWMQHKATCSVCSGYTQNVSDDDAR